ncbi:LCP family glycopolymer transferase [Pseudonocardia sichuanensis]
MTDDRRRTPGRERAVPPPRQPPRPQQAPPPAARRNDRGQRAVPPSRHPQPPRRPVLPADSATRQVPIQQAPARRPPRPRDEPATRPVPKSASAPTARRAPAEPRRPAPPRTPPPKRPNGVAPSPAPAAPPRAPARPATPPPDDAELPTTRNRALPPPRTSVLRKSGGRSSTAHKGEPEKKKGAGKAEERPAAGAEDQPQRSFGRALAAAAAATIAPGSGHLLLRRTRSGAVILGTFVLVLAVLAILVLTSDYSALLETALSSNVLVMGAIGCVVAALAWMAVIVRTYLLARPRGLGLAHKVVGVGAVTALCLVVAAPLGFGANLANSQRNLLNDLFAGGGGTAAAEAIAKPRLNILLVGSDAGPDRTGARTDTMMVANIDTRTGRTVLFSLPRNISYAQFPPGSPMDEEFPRGFHDSSDPLSGDYLLNAVYAYGLQHPELAPSGPTPDPGLNLLHQTVSEMLGLQLDYFVEVNMAGFASIIDALGGLTVDVGPERIPIGGITPSGRHVRPDGYIEPGVQVLSGEQSLAFARSRTGSTDYARMGRQRCLLQNILTQKSPTDLLTNFQAVAAATTNSVATNIPQEVLPALAALAGGEGGIALESVAFDPNLPDPGEEDGFFKTGDPDFEYMREVVQDAINRPAPPPAPTSAPPTAAARGADADADDEDAQDEESVEAASAAPTSLAQSCG